MILQLSEKLLQVLEAARIAPSACNFQPWHFVIIQKHNLRLKICSTYAKEWIQEAPALIVICGDHNYSWHRIDGKDHCDIDIAIAVDHMSLAAVELGLGSCWVCMFDVEKCKKILKLPASLEPIVLLPIGYPKTLNPPDKHYLRKSYVTVG